MIWDSETIDRLRHLWDEGHSTSEIGRRMNVSKNSIVGKVHRLDLDARPSPIRAKRSYTEPAPREAVSWEGPTLPPLASANSDPLSARLESGPPQAWITWCDGLSTSALNEMRRASHKADCMVASQYKSLRLWECTCGASQPGSEVVALPVKRQVVSEPVAAIIMRRALSEPITAAPTIFKPRRSAMCCWPVGEPGTKLYRTCDDTAEGGRPYCDEHVKLAYVKIRSRADVIADQPTA